jgi:hypothetical protein
MTRRIVLCLGLGLAAALSGCGKDATTGPTDTRRFATFNGDLDDPTKCTCGNGVNQFLIQPNGAGRLDAVATVQPADAKLVVRLLDSKLNTVYVVSSQTGDKATLGFDVVAGTYVLQAFLASDGPRKATFTLGVTYP